MNPRVLAGRIFPGRIFPALEGRGVSLMDMETYFCRTVCVVLRISDERFSLWGSLEGLGGYSRGGSSLRGYDLRCYRTSQKKSTHQNKSRSYHAMGRSPTQYDRFCTAFQGRGGPGAGPPAEQAGGEVVYKHEYTLHISCRRATAFFCLCSLLEAKHNIIANTKN